jgi:hypothetical protein
MRRPPDPQLLGFLEAYARPIADLALALCEIILEEVHDASESIIDLSGLLDSLSPIPLFPSLLLSRDHKSRPTLRLP